MDLDTGIKVSNIELNNQLKEGREPSAAAPPKGPEPAEPEKPQAETRYLEEFLEGEKIKQLIYRAFFYVLLRDPGLAAKDAEPILKTVWNNIEKSDFGELVFYLDRTVDGLWEKQRITRESYDILCSFKKIRRKIELNTGPGGADLSDELAELDELIHGKKVDTIT